LGHLTRKNTSVI